MIQFECPSCFAPLKAPQSAAGRKGTCKTCGTSITVPEVQEEVLEIQELIDLSEPVVDSFVVPHAPLKPNKNRQASKKAVAGTMHPAVWAALAGLCTVVVAVPLTIVSVNSLRSSGNAETPSHDHRHTLAAATSNPEDPVEAFTDLAGKFVPAINEVYKQHYEKSDSALVSDVFIASKEFKNTYPGPSFDVKKSDSLVSPFLAEIRTGGSVTYLEPIGTKFGVFSFAFAYQNGKWVPQGGEFSDGIFKIGPDTMRIAMERIGR